MSEFIKDKFGKLAIQKSEIVKAEIELHKGNESTIIFTMKNGDKIKLTDCSHQEAKKIISEL